MYNFFKNFFRCSKQEDNIKQKNSLTALRNISTWFGLTKITHYNNIRYIIPKFVIDMVYNYINTGNITSNNIITINNEDLINFEAKTKTLKTNIKLENICLIIHEFMVLIVHNCKIDFIIQVKIDAKSCFYLDKDVLFFRQANFENFEMDEHHIDMKIKDIYLKYPNFGVSKYQDWINNNSRRSNNMSSSNSIHPTSSPSNSVNWNKSKEMVNIESSNKKRQRQRSRKTSSSNNILIIENNKEIERNKTPNKRGNNTPSTNEKSNNHNSNDDQSDIMNYSIKTPKKNNYVVPSTLITVWSNYKKLHLSPIGLSNPSVYCFMNTCLQCLWSIPELNYYFADLKYNSDRKSNKKTYACHSFHDLINIYSSTKYDSIRAPSSIYETCHSFLESGRQHDCQEFLRRFLGRIQDELNYNKKYIFPDDIKMEEAWKMYKEVNPSLIDSIFCGLMRSSVKCCKCGHPSYTYDPFLDLSVSLEQMYSADWVSCLDEYFSSEKMDCDYKCGKCKKKTSIIKKLDISLPPPIWTVQLKRFKDNGRKITTAINYKHKLSLKDYICENDFGVQCNSQYMLFAVAVHLGGSISLGHYVAYVNREDKGKWYLCNDERISECTPKKAWNTDAYLLLYRQIE